MESRPAEYICGYLYKRSGIMLWKKRFFALKDEPTSLEDLKLYFERSVEIPQDPDNIEAYELVNKDLFENIANAAISGRGLLFYYDNEESKCPLSILNLSTVLKLDSPKFAPRKHSFTIQSSIDRLVLAAETEAEKDAWIKALVFFRSARETDPDLSETDEYKAVYNALVEKKLFNEAFSSITVEDIIGKPEVDEEVVEETVEEVVEEVADEPATEEVEEQVEEEPQVEAEQAEIPPLEQPSFWASIFSCSTGAVAVEEDDYSRYLSDKSFIMKGWLKKKSDVWGSWNDRFAVLYRDSLVYFRPAESVPAGKIDLDSTLTMEELGQFTIKVACAGHYMILKASSEEVYNRWKTAIEQLQ